MKPPTSVTGITQAGFVQPVAGGAVPAFPAAPLAWTAPPAVDFSMPPLSRSIVARGAAADMENAARAMVTDVMPEAIRNFGASTVSCVLPKGTTIGKVDRKVARKFGRIVDRTKLAHLHDMGDAILERLGESFKRLHKSNIHIDHRFSIVNCHRENAFVFSLVGERDDQRTNLVYVTTGLLRKLFLQERGNETADSGDSAIYDLASIIAHEMAHPLDKLDDDGFEKRYGYRSFAQYASYQATEVRADLEATFMLINAKLPARSLLDALEFILDEKKYDSEDGTATEIVMAGIITHPEDRLRLTAIRIFLALIDFERGERKTRALPDVSTAPIVAELETLAPAKKRGESKLPEPAGILETMSELKKICENPLNTIPRRLKFNWLLLWLDDLLIDAGDEISDEEFEAITKFNQRLAEDSKLQEAMPGSILDFNLQLDIEKCRRKIEKPETNHRYLVQKIPLYRSERYRSWLAEKIELYRDQAGREWEGKWSLILNNLRLVSPTPVILDVALPEMAGQLRGATDMPDFVGTLGKLQFEKEPAMDAVNDWRLARMAWFHENVYEDLGKREHVVAFLLDKRGLLPYFRKERHGRGTEYSLDRMFVTSNEDIIKKLNDPAYADLRASVTRAAGQIWQRRAMYAVLELTARTGKSKIKHLDWELIFNLLKMDPEKGYGEIEKSVKEFTKGDEYIELLEILNALPARFDYKLGRSTSFEKVTCRYHGVKKKWAGSDLYEYLRGDHNPGLRQQPPLQSLAHNLIAGSYLMSDRDVLAEHYEAELAELLPHEYTGTVEDFLSKHSSASIRLTNSSSSYDMKGRTIHLEDAWARAISRSNLPDEEKSKLLREIFIEGYNGIMRDRDKNSIPSEKKLGVYGWFGLEEDRVGRLAYNVAGKHGVYERAALEKDGIGRSVYEVLEKHGIVEDAVDMMRILGRLYKTHIDSVKNPTRLHSRSPRITKIEMVRKNASIEYIRAMDAMSDDLMVTLDKIDGIPDADEKLKNLIAFLDVLDPFDENYSDDMRINGGTIRKVKERVLGIAETFNLDDDDALAIFRHAVATGPTPHTDAFFSRKLESSLTEANDRMTQDMIDHMLLAGNFESRVLIARLARYVLEPHFSRRVGKSEAALDTLLEKITSLLPQATPQRDEILEDIAWRCDVRENFIDKIEELKSLNWRKANPLAVPIISMMSKWFHAMTDEETVSTIRYIMDPGERPLPTAIGAAIDRVSDKARERRTDLGEFADPVVARQTVQAVVADLTPMQRMPLLTLLLSQGSPAMIYRMNFPHNVTRELLGYEAGSSEERLLVAGLASIPDEEDYQVPVVLAYLLSISSEEKSGIKAIFEAFTAVGIQLGQIASIFWESLSDKAKEELQELKDRARPLSKDEIYGIMDATLTKGERSKIRRLVRVLGSASLRTAVLVELDDGREVVMLVQRPYAREQIAANLKRARRLLPELKKQGFVEYVGTIEAFLDPVGEQLANELDMRHEAKVLDFAGRYYEKMNHELRPLLGDWRFVVPVVIEGFQLRENMMFIDMISGGSFDNLPEGREKKRAGTASVMSALRGLFRFGFMQTDPHKGNYLFDPDQQTIGLIDWGQYENFQMNAGRLATDDRYSLTQFLWGVASADGWKTARFGERMGGNVTYRNGILAKKLSDAMSEHDKFPGRLVASINVLHGAGIDIPRRFSAGAIVGLMILAGEGYVGENTFKALLALEASHVIAEKLPRAVAGAIANRFLKSASYLFK